MKEFKCAQCEHVSKKFEEFRVHQWLYHMTTNGNTIYPKDLRREGYNIIKKEDLAFLVEWAEFGLREYHNIDIDHAEKELDAIKRRWL